MEPVNVVEILCPQDCVQVIYTILMKRRAHVTHEEPKPGTPFHSLRVEIPVIESFGFETDLRTATLGQAMALQMFSHWSVLPGDPLDKSIKLRALEPSQVP
jgi:U5 small nuclear ribonucleoprotein component